MKKRFGVISIASLMAFSVLLSACGSDKSNLEASTVELASESAYDTNGAFAYEMDSFAEEAKMVDDSESVGQVVDTSRKLITTMNISTETENLDEVLSGVQSKVKELGGYIESSNIYNGSRYSGRVVSRDASFTIRIPADKLDQFVSTLEEGTNITNKSTSVEDVTLQYVDTESRKKALKTEEDRLLEIIEKAETVEDIITVESRLSEVRYQLESIESQLRSYDNRVNYSTIYLDVTEVTQYTPTEEKGVVERMTEGFVNSCKAVWNAIVEFFVWIVIHIPQLLIIGIIVVVIVFIVKKKGTSKTKKVAVSSQSTGENQQQDLKS